MTASASLLLYMQRDRPGIRIVFASFCVKRDKRGKGVGCGDYWDLGLYLVSKVLNPCFPYTPHPTPFFPHPFAI